MLYLRFLLMIEIVFDFVQKYYLRVLVARIKGKDEKIKHRIING